MFENRIFLASLFLFCTYNLNASSVYEEGKATRRNIKVMEHLLDAYNHEHGYYPSEKVGLSVLDRSNDDFPVGMDEWGNNLIYHYPDGASKPVVLSEEYHKRIRDKQRSGPFEYVILILILSIGANIFQWFKYRE
jgi:hypothetical protein